MRKFTEQEVSDEQLHELLEAVRWSPSWANTQCWEVVVIKDQARKEQLAGMLSEKNPSVKAVTQAPLVLVICAKLGVAGYEHGENVEHAFATDKGDWFMFDAGIASQNICLAAYDMGLGTVHVGQIKHKEVDQLLGLPEGVCSVEVIPVGYPAKEGKAPGRKPLENFVHYEKYGQGQ
jgi:nitroreductase